jgi:dTMP kinase
MAYQGYGRGLLFKDIAFMNKMASDGLVPNLTIIFDIDPEIGMARKGKPTDRIEANGMDFHKRVREGFRELFLFDSKRFRMVDASKPISEVIDIVVGILKTEFGWKTNPET